VEEKPQIILDAYFQVLVTWLGSILSFRGSVWKKQERTNAEYNGIPCICIEAL